LQKSPIKETIFRKRRTHAIACTFCVRRASLARAGEQESKRVREQESKRAREQESKRAREQDSKTAREQESKRVREQESKRAREQESKTLPLSKRGAESHVQESKTIHRKRGMTLNRMCDMLRARDAWRCLSAREALTLYVQERQDAESRLSSLALFYRALLQKRPIMLRSLLSIATPLEQTCKRAKETRCWITCATCLIHKRLNSYVWRASCTRGETLKRMCDMPHSQKVEIARWHDMSHRRLSQRLAALALLHVCSYGVATISRLLKIIGLFLQKGPIKESKRGRTLNCMCDMTHLQ